MKKLLHVMLWLNPISATVMASKLIAEKIKAKRAAKKASAQETAIIDELQSKINVQAEQAQASPQAAPDVVGTPTTGNSVEEISEQLSDTHDDSAMAEEIQAEGDGFMNASGGGDMKAAMKAAFDEAKKKANALTGNAKTEALATIAELEKSLDTEFLTAKSELKSADKTDVAQAQGALKTVKMGKVASTATTTTVAPVGKADKEEQLATGITPVSGVPMWAYYTLGGVAVLGLGYYVYVNYIKEK